MNNDLNDNTHSAEPAGEIVGAGGPLVVENGPVQGQHGQRGATAESHVRTNDEVPQVEVQEQRENSGTNIVVSSERLSELYDMISAWALAMPSGESDFGMLLSSHLTIPYL